MYLFFLKGKPIHFVKSDSDCMMAPCQPPPNPADGTPHYKPKTSGIGLWAMTKAEAEIQYITGACRGNLCDDKCRCDNEEELYTWPILSSKHFQIRMLQTSPKFTI